MKLSLPKLFPRSPKKEVRKTADKKEVKTSSDIPQMSTQTAIWVGATLVFATLFFLSSVLDMKVRVSFGNNPAITTSAPIAAPAGGSAPAGGIASQVGGC